MSTPWLATFPTPSRDLDPSQESEALTRIAGAPAVLIPARRATDYSHRTRTSRPGWFLTDTLVAAEGRS